jgi:hypothetical protein
MQHDPSYESPTVRPEGDRAELREGLPGGRRELRLRIGSFTVDVTEIPGKSISEREWQDILLARRSYAAMWGGGASDRVTNDPFDGLAGSPYRAWHYIAWVRDGDWPRKLVTMRKVAVVPAELTDRQREHPEELLPDDIRFWRVETGDQTAVPLWTALRAHARRLAPHDDAAELRIASTGRTGTFPHGERQATPRQRERTGIAFAAIQVLATHGDPCLLYVCTLCPEFRDRVLGVSDVDGVYVSTAHTPTETVLGLPPGSVRLDNGLRVVREHKVSFPGYFVDNDDAARSLVTLLDEGAVTVEDLSRTVLAMVAQEMSLGTNVRLVAEALGLIARPDHRRLAEILTRPQLFKYLIPRLASDEPLAAMSAEELRASVLYRTKDGPFSATMVVQDWAASAWAILEAAARRHGRSGPSFTRPTRQSRWIPVRHLADRPVNRGSAPPGPPDGGPTPLAHPAGSAGRRPPRRRC